MATRKKKDVDHLRNSSALVENQKKTIDSLNTLIDILKSNMAINQEIMEEQSEEIVFSEIKEKFFFSFLEKEGYDIIDVYEFINESSFNISPELKKDVIDSLMNSHKEYKEKNNDN